MSKQEYMEQLKAKLKRLPKEDFARAVEYYEEYFAEAGCENEEQAIEDLGSPQEAADQIICDMALNYSKEPIRNVKKGMDALWVILLAICAAPIALPFLLAGVILVAAAFLVAITLLLSLLLVAVCAVVTGPISVVAGFSALTKSIPVFLSCLGIGFVATGLGALAIYGMYFVCKSFISWTIRSFAKMIQNRKGGK